MALAEQPEGPVGSVPDLTASQLTDHIVGPAERHESQAAAVVAGVGVGVGVGDGVGVGVWVVVARCGGVGVSKISKRGSQTSHVVGQHCLEDSALK